MPSSQPPPEPWSAQQRGELALALGRFFSLELIAAVIRAAQEMGLGGFSSLQKWSGKSQILSEKQALFLAKDLFEWRNILFLKAKRPGFQLCVRKWKGFVESPEVCFYWK